MSDASVRPGMPAPRTAVALALFAWVALVAVRLTAPSDLLTRDQQRVAAYVLDASERGAWLFQEDFHGNVASKPPLFNWLAAAATECVGSLERFALAFPSWLCSGLVTLLVLVVASRFAGRAAGVWAAILYLYSQLGLRQVLLVRSDTVFQCAVFFATVLAWRSWETGRGHWKAWVAGALGTLTKGPLAVLLVAFGFAAVIHERRSGQVVPVLRGRLHLLGAGLLVVITAAWFFTADHVMDGRVWQKLIIDELVGHAVGGRDDFGFPGEHFYRPPAWFVSRLFPMGALAALAVWRVFRRAAERDADRRLERLLGWQIVLGVALFSLASENRFVHLLPLMPAGAVLAGRELDELLRRWRPRWSAQRAQLTFVVAAAALSAVYLSFLDAQKQPLLQGADTLTFARRIEAVSGPEFTPLNLDAPDALFAHLTAFVSPTAADEVDAQLAGDAPCYVATRDPAAIEARVPAVQRCLEGPFGEGGTLAIVGNRAELPPAAAPGSRIDAVGTLAFLLAVALLFAVLARRAARGIRSAESLD